MPEVFGGKKNRSVSIVAGEMDSSFNGFGATNTGSAVLNDWTIAQRQVKVSLQLGRNENSLSELSKPDLSWVF
jgi:hypothetical protein